MHVYNQPCATLQEKDDTLAFNGDVSAQLDNALMSVMFGVQLCLVASKSFDHRGIFIQMDRSLPASSCTSGDGIKLLLLVGCLTSQQHARVSQGRICSDNYTCCYTETEVADQAFNLTQTQYTDTRPTSPSTDPITPGTWQSSHMSQFLSHWHDSTWKIPHSTSRNQIPDLLLPMHSPLGQQAREKIKAHDMYLMAFFIKSIDTYQAHSHFSKCLFCKKKKKKERKTATDETCLSP